MLSRVLVAGALALALDFGAAEAQMSQPPIVGDGASVGVSGGTISLLATMSSNNTYNGNFLAGGTMKLQGPIYCGASGP